MTYSNLQMLADILKRETQGIRLENQLVLLAIEALVVFLIWLITRKKGITLRRLIHIYLFLVYTGIVLTLTIFRRPVGSREGIVHLYIKLGLGLKGGNPSLWGSTFGFYNVLLFIPLGIFIYLFFRNRCKKSGIVLATIIGAGMSLAIENNKEMLKKYVIDLQKATKNEKIIEFLNKWLNNNLILDENDYEQLLQCLDDETKSEALTNVLKYKNYFTKKSVWIIGGDGWAYDIGYGGLDHLLSSTENVNILVLDSEVYSNTGGQASKSTQKGATAKFASAGKKTKKKDLAQMAMSYKTAYVACISLGANMSQTIKAFKEAEEYNGVSLIIAYAPCINHGFDMSNSNEEMKRAVMSGYWNLFRFNPAKENPLEIDSAEPTLPYKEFLLGESRYKALYKTNPELADELFAESEKDANERRETLLNLKKYYDDKNYIMSLCITDLTLYFDYQRLYKTYCHPY